MEKKIGNSINNKEEEANVVDGMGRSFLVSAPSHSPLIQHIGCGGRLREWNSESASVHPSIRSPLKH
jgi:hypothetical protein